MKYAILFLLPFLSAVAATGQTEYYIPHPEEKKNLFGGRHVMDEAGNVYVAGTESPFQISAGTSIHGDQNSFFCKIDVGGKMIWSLPYAGSSALYSQGPVAISLFFTDKNMLTAPATLYNKKGVLQIDARNGSLLSEKTYKDTCCSESNLINSFVTPDGLRNLYAVRSYSPNASRLLQQEVDRNLNETAKYGFDMGLKSIGFPIAYDAAHEELLLSTGSSYVLVCDAQLRERRRICIFDSAVYQNLGIVCNAANGSYYAFSYRMGPLSTPNTFQDYLLITDRAGWIVSRTPAPLFKDLIFAKDNTIWGLVNPSASEAASPGHPVTIMQFNPEGKLRRQLNIGKPLTIGEALSIYNDDELIVTGTFATNLPNAYPAQTPAQLYVYRRQVRSILPLSTANGCDGVAMFPNPTNSKLYLTTNISGQYETTISNCLGQRIGTYTFNQPATTLDMDSYASGVYFVRVSGEEHQCNIKVMRE